MPPTPVQAHTTPAGPAPSWQSLVEDNLQFVFAVAKEFTGRGVSYEDLVGEGFLGAITAAQKFDPERGCKFITYAVWWIRKAMLKAITDHSRVVRLPAGHYRDWASLRNLELEYDPDDGQSHGKEDAAADLEWSEERTRNALRVYQAERSLDEPLTEDGFCLGDKLQSTHLGQEKLLLNKEQKALVLEAVSTLTEQEQTVLNHRFGFNDLDPLTLRALGEKMNLSRERVRQLEMRALNKLRRYMGEKMVMN